MAICVSNYTSVTQYFFPLSRLGANAFTFFLINFVVLRIRVILNDKSYRRILRTLFLTQEVQILQKRRFSNIFLPDSQRPEGCTKEKKQFDITLRTELLSRNNLYFIKNKKLHRLCD